ncbi:Rubrerythrin [Anaerobranca californiensis DSM 14826]|jgi:rubrerythrin|uniref:Rubrerythrin n=1 Tax=Anaerobranca californiensis DSM 14826 TaxID=1120989 RepID=A0A1M6NZQ8_9FIRM|nr:ferritin family protein [Anaerobranca californiensis]SHK01161.1 Rubrerythrin [Anaerobranca californiensis DSM 14826]
MDEKTLKNLKEAFAGESQANRKYLAFAKKAEEEGYINAAKMFRAAAEAETIHAHAHLKAMKGIGTTAENLKEGVMGETYEFESMYPEMVKQAEEAGEKEALRSFKFAMEAERVHAKLYQQILDNLDSQEELTFYLCTICGNVELQPVDKCLICGAGEKAFKIVE